MSEPTLADKVLFVLRTRFPRATLNCHTTDHGNVLMIEYIEADHARHYFSTPPAQDYRQHGVPWLLHRFVDLINPVYAANEVRATLDHVRAED